MITNKDNDELRARIYGWLTEEGIKFQPVSDAEAAFNFGIEIPGGLKIHVLMPIASYDMARIVIKIGPSPEQQNRLSLMDAGKRNDLLWDLRLGLVKIGVMSSPVVMPLDLLLSSAVYSDGLNKNIFMEEFLRVIRASAFVSMIVDKTLGAPTPTMDLSYIR